MQVKQLLEMAKRTTPEAFYKMAIDMYGKTRVKSISMPEVVAIAKKNDVQVPPYVVKQKVARGRFNLEPAGEHASTDRPQGVPASIPNDLAKRVMHWDDERGHEEGNIMVTTAKGWCFDPGSHVSSFPTPSAAITALKRLTKCDCERCAPAKKSEEKGPIKVDKIVLTPSTGFGRYGRTAQLFYKDDYIGMGTGATDDEAIVEALIDSGMTHGEASDARIDIMKTKPRIDKHPDIIEDPQYDDKPAKTVSEDTLKQIVREIISGLKQISSVYQTSDPEVQEWKGKKSAHGGVRDWGGWAVPDDEEDDGDYDWKVLTPVWSKKLHAFADKIEKKYPDLRISIQTGEKNWIDIQVGQK